MYSVSGKVHVTFNDKLGAKISERSFAMLLSRSARVQTMTSRDEHIKKI